MFLKKISFNGFKSFAKPLDLDFNHQMIGIVGPNGSGKSNIVDAIKWVLGERSNKQIRGNVSTDVIFKGSASTPGAKFAEVTLVFDNSAKSLHTELKEIAITRKIAADNGQSEYYINGEQCTQKEVIEIFLDCGLDKNSLGIISQGKITEFVESKAENRRKIFEDAAGIQTYLNEKKLSNANLEHANENYIRKNDMVNELAKDIKKLSSQAEKAQICAEKKKELTKIELTILGKDINYNSSKLETITAEFNSLTKTIDNYKPEQDYIQKSIADNKELLEKTDAQIEIVNGELSTATSDFSAADLKRTQLLVSLESQTKSTNLTERIDGYRKLIEMVKFEIEEYKKRIINLDNEINVFGDSSKDIANKIADYKYKVETLYNELATLRFQLQQVNANSGLQGGVRQIVENKSIFNGFRGLVKDFVDVDEQYEKAIYAALGNRVNFVIINSEYDAQNALKRLKESQAGVATFLPLDFIKPRGMKPEYLEILQHSTGFIGIASDLIKYPKEYDIVYKNLLGNTIVADTIQNAITISKMTYQMFQVYSLDGDVINAGGSITGGYNKSMFGKLKVTPEQLMQQISEKETEYNNAKIEYDRLQNTSTESTNTINSKVNLKIQYEEILKGKEKQLFTYELEYKQYESQATGKTESFKKEIETTATSLRAKCDKLSVELNNLRLQKMKYSSTIEDSEQKLNTIREQMDRCRDTLLTVEKDKIQCESILNRAKEIINNEYKLTLDYVKENYNTELPMSDDQARLTIEKLRQDIDSLGDINWEAIKELDKKREQYESDIKVLAELKEACDKIKENIRKLDKQAKKNFMEVINSVNETIPEIFHFLFGGGRCEVALTDPDNFLETGIEIITTLPGKTSVPLNLLSGGEKSLIALAILFAILKHKSLPLIILDEADGALDVANVVRFGQIIRSYSDKTQFIVISHRDGTMEQCNVLFGITMLGTGISKVYTTSLEEAKKLVPDTVDTVN